ncbi:MAG: glycoside hydrolase family 2, partial [Clostridia bacterium]|nr:glycoside hydrolase family 2 [Clostridia bacterium]
RDGATEALGEILVPFPPESRLSGIERRFDKNDTLVYERTVTLPDGFTKDRLMLHFGAVDQYARVLVNGTPVGAHEGGYHPFSLDVTDAWREGENVLCVEVRDPLDKDLPYGKQREKRGGMWYTPTSGIWQTVWLEALPAEHITSLRLTPTLDSVTVETVGGAAQKMIILHTEAGDKEYVFEGDRFVLAPDEVKLWTPDAPYLYRFTLVCGEDRIESYFALRTVSVVEGKRGPVLALNGKPYLFHGLLDQGYFSDGIYLPASSEGYRYDIETMKSLGFDMLRKHIKIEPALFYYYCDKLGMVVFQDMVNSGPYSFLIDTALPTAGLKRGVTHHASPRRRAAFESAARDTVELLYNHPSVCYYTIFNEGWGQYDTDRIYDELKALDPTRIWDSASGWFRPKRSDVQSEHVYFKPVKQKANKQRPVVLSEFGGYCLGVEGHIFNLDKSYGYATYADSEALTVGFEKLYGEQIVPALQSTNLCALVLTQVSDVEDEVNGLVTYDRQCVKVDPARMREIAERLRRAFDA